MSGTVKVAGSITPVDPFSGRVLGEPRPHIEHVPTEIDYEPVPDGTMDEIMAWVEGSGERARAATMAELRRGAEARPKLLRRLQAV